jgi:hypothetical protein
MIFLLAIEDLSITLAVTAAMLLVATQLLSLLYGKINILINKKRLKYAAITFSILFLGTAILRVTEILGSL